MDTKELRNVASELENLTALLLVQEQTKCSLAAAKELKTGMETLAVAINGLTNALER